MLLPLSTEHLAEAVEQHFANRSANRRARILDELVDFVTCMRDEYECETWIDFLPPEPLSPENNTSTTIARIINRDWSFPYDFVETPSSRAALECAIRASMLSSATEKQNPDYFDEICATLFT